jgi:hypothetical protein
MTVIESAAELPATARAAACAPTASVPEPMISIDPALYVPLPPPYRGAIAFAVPIVIRGAAGLKSWQFSVLFDPTDVQVHVACARSGAASDGHAVTGPVSPGPFLAGVAAFAPFFDPGVVLNDVGVVDAVAGVWPPQPRPADDGILAYIDFVTTRDGTGLASITVVRVSTTTAAPAR